MKKLLLSVINHAHFTLFWSGLGILFALFWTYEGVGLIANWAKSTADIAGIVHGNFGWSIALLFIICGLVRDYKTNKLVNFQSKTDPLSQKAVNSFDIWLTHLVLWMVLITFYAVNHDVYRQTFFAHWENSKPWWIWDKWVIIVHWQWIALVATCLSIVTFTLEVFARKSLYVTAPLKSPVSESSQYYT